MGRWIGRTKGGKLYAVSDAERRPIHILTTTGRVGGYTGTVALLNSIKIMFGWMKDWRRVATRYVRCPKYALRRCTRSNCQVLAIDARTTPDHRQVPGDQVPASSAKLSSGLAAS